MLLNDRIVVVTGGAAGIGRALARRFAAEGARHVVVVDVDAGSARRVAAEVGGTAVSADVTQAGELARVVEETEERVGPIADVVPASTPAVIRVRTACGQSTDTPMPWSP